MNIRPAPSMKFRFFLFVLVAMIWMSNIGRAQVVGVVEGHRNRMVEMCGQPRPTCMSAAEYQRRCIYEQVYETLLNDPPIWELKVTLKTGRKDDAGTDDDVYIQFTNKNSDKVYLDRIQDDFEKGANDWYHVVGGSVTKLSDITRLRIGMEGTDGWCLDSLSVQVNGSATLFSYNPAGCIWLDDDGKKTLIPRGGFLADSKERHRAMKLPNIIPLRQKVEAALGNAIGHIPGLSWNIHASESDTLKVTGDANAVHVRAWLEWKGRVPVPIGTETATVRLTLKFDLVNSGGAIEVRNYSLKHTHVSVTGIQGAIADILNIDDREVKRMLRKIDLGQGFKGLNIPLGVGTVRPTRVSFFQNGDVSLSWPDNVATLVAMVNNELVPGPVDCEAMEADRNRDRSTALDPPAQFLGKVIWKDFYGSWKGNRKKNTHRLLDFEPYREGNKGDFEGIWRKGKADTHLSFTDGWKSFYDMYKAQKAKGLRLVDFETYAVGKKRRYVGLWRKGTPDSHLWYVTGSITFYSKWQELFKKGYRLVEFEVYRVGNKRRYIGLCRAARDGI